MEAHPQCSSEGVQGNLECQDCAVKNQIIASVRKFAESMLSKNMNVEPMNMLLQMVGPAPELQKQPDSLHQPADNNDLARGLSLNEITKTVACTISDASNKFCLNSHEGQMNPSLASESAAGAPSIKSENLETIPAVATMNQKLSGEEVADKKDLSKPAATDNCKEMVHCEKLKSKVHLVTKLEPKENSAPLKAACGSQTLMLHGKISHEQADETFTDNAVSPLVSVTNICAQISKCEETALKPVYQKNVPSDKLLVVNGINEGAVKLLTEKTNLMLTKCTTNDQVKCAKNTKIPPIIVAPLNQIKHDGTKIIEFEQEAEKCKVKQPLNKGLLKTQVASCLPVTKATEISQTQPGTSGRMPGSSSSPISQAKRSPNPQPRTIHQAKYEGTWVGSRDGSRRAIEPHWGANATYQPYWRNFYFGRYMPYNLAPRQMGMPLLRMPLRGLRPVFWPPRG